MSEGTPNTISIPYEWKPRLYQEPAWNALEQGCKRVIMLWHRRAGKDLTAIHWCATQAFQRPGLYWHLFPTYSQGRKVIWEGADRAGTPFLNAFPEGTWYRRRDEDMTLWLHGGSRYQVVGTDYIDRLMGANPVGVILSEYALQNHQAWELIRPILAENGGWAVFPYCVAGDTLVPTEDGLLRMEEIAEGRDIGFSPYTRKVQGLGGAHAASDFYRSGRQPTLRLRTRKGYEIECTPNHKLWTGDGWKSASQWRVGDALTIAVEGGLFGRTVGWNGWTPKEGGSGTPKSMPFERPDEDFYYFLGLCVADGYWSQYNVVITNNEDEIHEFLSKYGFVKRDDVHSICSNRNLSSLLTWFGIGQGAHRKCIPRRVRQLPRPMLRAFLQGYFDGDGCARTDGAVQCDSVSEDLIRTLQSVLLQFGIVSGRSVNTTPPTERVRVESVCHRLHIGGWFAARFYEEIGFRLERKQCRLSLLSDRQRRQRADVVPVPREVSDRARDAGFRGHTLRQLRKGAVAYCTLDRYPGMDPWVDQVIGDRFHWDAIASIEDSEAEVFDFHIPETHSCVYNGINGHQTPRGRNHGYRLFRDALENPNWFVSKLTVDDTNSIDASAIEEDRASGMPEEMVQQEYWCFPAGSRVHTFGGQVPIEDITVGTRVLTHTGRFRRVTATHSRETGEPLVSIKTFGHYERLRLTPKHPVRTIDPATQTYGWTPAMDVKKGDWLVLPRMRHGRTFVSRDLAWLAAWYIAEGSVQKTAVQWSLGYGEMDVAESLREAAGGQAFILEKPPEIHVQVNDTRLADMLAARCGSASNEKRIPWDFVSGHEQLFFDQLMRGDGCDTDRGWSYTTTSLTLAHDVQALASSLGLQSGIAFRKGVKDGTIGGRAVRSADSYCVQISRGKPSAMMRPAKNGIAVRVRDVIVESPEDRTVYNLSVQHDESYVVSGRVVHNCSFEAAMVGAYYGEQLAWMREQEPSRISDEVVWAPNKEVVTGWDLGYGDRTAIWFAQVIRNELRLIDYYECSGEPIDHYVKVMRERPYVYGDAFLPHDAAAKSLQTGKSILEQLYSLGVRAIVNPQLSKEDKIGAVRLALRTTWIAEKACETGLSALSEYVKKQDVNQRGLNNEILYLDQPLRNWATHGADALAELVIGFRPERRSEFRQPDASYVT